MNTMRSGRFFLKDPAPPRGLYDKDRRRCEE